MASNTKIYPVIALYNIFRRALFRFVCNHYADVALAPPIWEICFFLSIAYLFAHLASSIPLRIIDQRVLIAYSLVHCD